MQDPPLAIRTRLAALAVGIGVASVMGACGGVHTSARSLTTTVAQRDQSIRGLRFHSLPRVTVVDIGALATLEQRHMEAAAAAPPRQSQRQTADYRREQEATDEAAYLIGLLQPGENRTVAGGPGPGQLEGLYDSDSERVFLVRQSVGSSPRARALVLAHELEHALDEQHFGADASFANPASDSAAAGEAVREGTATLVQLLYAHRYLGAAPPATVIARLRPSLPGDSRVARDADSEIAFVYGAGTRFVFDLYRRGHGWSLVNRALAEPPTTSAQVLHPDLYVRGIGATKVAASARPYLPRRWRRVLVGDVGEEDLAQLLDRAATPTQAARAAPEWAGGRFELWQRAAGLGGCAPPCRRRAALLVAIRWRTPGAARRFRAGLPGYVARDLSATAISATLWRVDDGAAAAATAGTITTLAFAPTATLARTIAAGGLRQALAGR